MERRGLVDRDLENAWLAADTEAGPLDDLLGHSITYRIAVGPRAEALYAADVRLDCRDRKGSRTVPPARAGSPCTPVWTWRRISVRSSNDCAAM